VLVPRPQPPTFGAAPIRDAALLAWATEAVQQLFAHPPSTQQPSTQQPSTQQPVAQQPDGRRPATQPVA
jgi:hypothetical protein